MMYLSTQLANTLFKKIMNRVELEDTRRKLREAMLVRMNFKKKLTGKEKQYIDKGLNF